MQKFCYTFVTLEDDVLKSPFLSYFLRNKFIQVPSSALKKKRPRHKPRSFSFSVPKRTLNPGFKVVFAPLRSAQSRGLPDLVRLAAEWLRRSVRWEKGPLDLFLFPPHPIFRLSSFVLALISNDKGSLNVLEKYLFYISSQV